MPRIVSLPQNLTDSGIFFPLPWVCARTYSCSPTVFLPVCRRFLFRTLCNHPVHISHRHKCSLLLWWQKNTGCAPGDSSPENLHSHHKLQDLAPPSSQDLPFLPRGRIRCSLAPVTEQVRPILPVFKAISGSSKTILNNIFSPVL